CLDGGNLRVAAHEHEGFYNDRFRLAGPRHLLKEIASQQHGHQLEVTGRVTDARGTEHVGRTTKIGVKVTAYGGGDDIPPAPARDTTSTLQVLSYRETSETCKS